MRRYYYNFKARLKFFLRKKQSLKALNGRPSVALIYYIPKSQKSKYNNWRDGFTKAIEYLGEEDFVFTWINLEDHQPTSAELNKFDFIIAKTGWYAKVDEYLRRLKNLNTPRGIVVSCSHPINEDFVLFFYDVVWYQSFYNKQFVKRHPNIYHSYGANLKDFSEYLWNPNSAKIYDVISIGVLEPYKRFEKLLDIPGKKLIIGSTKTDYFSKMAHLFEENDVEVLDFVPQNQLPKYLDQAKCLYIPANIHGGGERIIMEFKKSGIPIVIESDNPKLKEILEGPDWDELSYAEGIRKGMNSILSTPNTHSEMLPDVYVKTGRKTYKEGGGIKIDDDLCVEIGSFCKIGRNFEIKNNPNVTKKKIIIGNDVVIEEDVEVLAGIEIGDGAIIRKNSKIKTDIEPYSIVEGNPAKIIGKRFNENIVSQLLEIKWWLWSDNKIKRNNNFFAANFNKEGIPEIL